MEKIKYILIVCVSALFYGGLTSCSEQNYKLFDPSQTGIYFTEDSVIHSFGVTKLEITSYEMELPVMIMGRSADYDRNFKVELVKEKTTAEANVHYIMPTEMVIHANSIGGVLPITILRGELGSAGHKQVAFRLIETEDFKPEEEVLTISIASFNNIVEPPRWYDWTGTSLTWPTYKLGVWDPAKWVKFMEYFRAMEETVPATYNGMVDMYGPDLTGVQFGWMDEYNYAATKYILTPLYDYFAANPGALQSGVNDIPKPY